MTGDDRLDDEGQRIRKLPQHLINRIAAGEIVERPASVVKELIENSLDAGADSISISVEDGGKESITVLDDGKGILSEDLKAAVQPHATSKIFEPGQLTDIATLGFRGEALASIASVSDMEVCSRHAGADVGSSLRVRGGEEGELRPWGGPEGTRVRVRNLFYNAPVRRKQLKRSATEMSHILDVVRGIALANPQVAFRLMRDGSEALFSSGSAELHKTAAEIFGADAIEEMMAFGEPESMIFGFAGSPALARSRRDRQYFIVNGRVIEHDGLRAVVENCYRGFLEERRFPFCIAVIKLQPARVDVNVHPAKKEVRIDNVREVTGKLYNEVRQALMALPVPRWELQKDEEESGLPDSEDEVGGSEKQIQAHAVGSAELVAEGQRRYFLQGDDQDTSPEDIVFEHLRPLGQVAKTYVLAEGPEGLYLVDQHAACERLYYEQALAKMQKGRPISQQLLTPYVYRADPEEMRLYEQHQKPLKQIGFEVEKEGDDRLIVTAVPAYGEEPVSPGKLDEVLDAMQQGEKLSPGEIVAAATASCHAAVRAGDVLSQEEIQHLFAELDQLKRPQTCPHGRPTVVVMTHKSLAKMFGRT